MNTASTLVLSLFLLAGPQALGQDGDGQGHYTERPMFQSRPDPTRERFFGVIGTTGLVPRVYPGVALVVEDMVPGSPAEGKFAKGEVITGINGIALKGINPFVAMGNALTMAEAKGGKMVFDVTSADGKTQRKQTVTIPVLGAYSETWPLNCSKSKQIIAKAAAFYADRSRFSEDGIPGALACLFLLSTGDDSYLPSVKAYFAAFPEDVKAIGDNTWNNGYNGIACGEYYLRTGDKSVLPIMQHYCDDAKERQVFDAGWTHWGRGVSPGYVAGGLMNPAGAQVLTTLLLGKECGVNVDDKTLINALRYFYRFAGHGGVAYGDHCAEGGFGSNGKDGMVAAAMLIASGAEGDVTIYELASKCLAMTMMESYPGLAMGHGDEGRGDGIWHGLVNSYLRQEKPALYREAMDRLRWWHDLSREHGGSIGIATVDFYGSRVGSSGPGMGLSYTAPLRTLRITGAPRSKFSKKFTLPKRLWGTEADLAFLSIEHSPKYFDYGPEEPAHLAFFALGDAYQQPQGDLSSLPREVLLKNVHHRRYVVRVKAAIALRKVGALDDLERLLSHPDPRLRRAALDGLIDWNFWFATGDDPISTEQFTPGMLAAVVRILSEPDESWYVKAGALMALELAPAKDIRQHVELIKPWIEHSDWWMREPAFKALAGLRKDDAQYLDVLPTLLAMATREGHTQPRERMLSHFESVVRAKGRDSEAGRLILSGLAAAVTKTEIKSGDRSSEGAHSVMEALNLCLRNDISMAAPLALVSQARFGQLSTDDLIRLVAAPGSAPNGHPFGLYTALESLAPEDREVLVEVLLRIYRPELLARLRAERDAKPELLDSIIDLTKLANPNAGWQPIGKVAPSERTWRFRSFDAAAEADRLPARERKRFRDIAMPSDLDGWFTPGFDDSGWAAGRAPIGTGLFRQGDLSFANRADWGRGEFIVMRTTFEVDALDCDSYRLSILCPQGFRVYLNGEEIAAYGWWQDKPNYSPWGSSASQHLKVGTNVIAVYSNVAYDESSGAPYGQVDCCIEGLKLSDLELD